MPKPPARPRAAPRWVVVAMLVAVAAVLTACTSAGMGIVTPTTPTPTAPPPSTPAATQAATPTATSAGGGTQATGTCSPSGSSLQISAHNIKFDKSCLAAPANQAFTITFDNEDAGVPHDVAIFTNSSATTALFTGAVITGPATVTYHVPALKAGTYYFRCNIHPTVMFGTFVVG